LHPFLYFCDFQDQGLRDAVRLGREQEFATFHWTGPIPDALDPATFQQSKLSWTWVRDDRQAGLRQLYKELLDARRRWPPLADFRCRRAELLEKGLLRLVRGNSQRPAQTLTAFFNLMDESQPLPAEARGINLLLRSEEARFGGFGGDGNRLAPFEFAAFGGPWTTT
jgi:maltooligosyltrehalose trehalohydrolase